MNKLLNALTFKEKLPNMKYSQIFAFAFVIIIFTFPKRYIYPHFSPMEGALINFALVGAGWIALLIIDIKSNKEFFTREKIVRYVQIRIRQLILLLVIFSFMLFSL